MLYLVGRIGGWLGSSYFVGFGWDLHLILVLAELGWIGGDKIE
jgi:hypothetical protein